MASKDDREHSASNERNDNVGQHSPTLIQRIEAETKRSITIQTTLTSKTLLKCNQQPQSPLFILPAEIREIIFSLATAPHYKPDSLFEETDRRRRPDHLAPVTTSTSLLSTCRRIWLEANHLPMQQAHHCFWAPDPLWHWTDPRQSNSRLTSTQLSQTRRESI